MRIKNVASGTVLLELDPGQCLMLADACDIAATAAMEENQPATLREGLTLASGFFEALALLGDVGGHVTHPRDLRNWELAKCRKAWGWLPEWKHEATR